METKVCQNCKNDFTIEPEDFEFYDKMKVPPPTFCPECRRQRRLSWRNDYVFYNRECDSCKRKIISIYSPDNSQVIYCNTCWWGDSWDPKSFARDFDFARPFFEQFAELRREVPALALVNDNGSGSVNSEYVENVQFSKNCYMAMVSWKLENCMYFSYGAEAQECVDCMGIFDPSEALYESMYISKSFGCRHVRNSTALMNCAYVYDCQNCENCFMSAGLRNKKYYFKNEQYSKEEYEKIVESYELHTWTGSQRTLQEFEEFILEIPRPHSFLLSCVDCIGNNLVNSKNAKFVFHVKKAEDSKYLENGDTETASYDLCVGGELGECYEGLTPDHSHRAAFTSFTWKSLDVFYTDFCQSCQDCFGCVGLKHSKYSIFNKEYSKEEYESLKNKIITHMKQTGEWGEFFPSEISPFAYNETMAQLSFPLSKEEAIARNLKWQDNIQMTTGKATTLDVPDSILDVNDSITDEILECQKCQRNYKITPDELAFYRKWKIPVPRYCFFCRIAKRFELRLPSQLWERSCMCENGNHAHSEKCQNNFHTPYSPDRPEKVFCEDCYNKEIY